MPLELDSRCFLQVVIKSFKRLKMSVLVKKIWWEVSYCGGFVEIFNTVLFFKELNQIFIHL